MLILGLFSYVYAAENIIYNISGTINYDLPVPMLYNGSGDISNNFTKYIATQITGNSSSTASILKSINFVTSLDGVDTTNAINVGYESSTTTNDDYVAYWSKYNVWVYSESGKFFLPENSDYMFYECSSLTTLDLSNLDTSRVTSMNSMFGSCSGLGTLDLSSFDTSRVTSMGSMFGCCSGLETLDLSTFDTSSVTVMWGMFWFCTKLATLNVDNFDTSNVEITGYMFAFCGKLTTLNLSSFDTSSVTRMGKMFSGCSSLTSLDLSNFDTSNVTDIDAMFGNCSNLTELNISSFDLTKVDGHTEWRDIIYYCSALTKIYCPTNINSLSIDLPSGTWTWTDASGVNQGTVTTLQQGGTLTRA